MFYRDLPTCTIVLFNNLTTIGKGMKKETLEERIARQAEWRANLGKNYKKVDVREYKRMFNKPVTILVEPE